eukprot:jgi/Botrbrau1/19348/Bobra.0073s0073.1
MRGIHIETATIVFLWVGFPTFCNSSTITSDLSDILDLGDSTFRDLVDLLEADPLRLQESLQEDWTNWASVFSQILLKKEGTKSGALHAAHQIISGAKVWLESWARGSPMEPLLALQDEVLEWEVNPFTRTPRPDVKEHKEGALRDLHGSETRSKAKQSSPPRPLGPKDAVYAGKKSTTFAVPQTNLIGVGRAKIFFNFAPCLVENLGAGISTYQIGINIAPKLLQLSLSAGSLSVSGLSISPTLLAVSASAISSQSTGAIVSPILMAVGPTGVSIQSTGLQVSPVGLSVGPSGIQLGPRGVVVASGTSVGSAGLDLDRLPQIAKNGSIPGHREAQDEG